MLTCAISLNDVVTTTFPPEGTLERTQDECVAKCSLLGVEGCGGYYLFKTAAGVPKCNGLIDAGEL